MEKHTSIFGGYKLDIFINNKLQLNVCQIFIWFGQSWAIVYVCFLTVVFHFVCLYVHLIKHGYYMTVLNLVWSELG